MKILIVEEAPLVQEVLHALASDVRGEARVGLAASCAEAVAKAQAAGRPVLLVCLPPRSTGARAPGPPPGPELTGRQVDVLRLIARGLPNKEIALRLRIAENTVKQHARAAYSVLGVSSRMAAVSAVARHGIPLD